MTRITYRIKWVEIDGSYNESLVMAKRMSDAIRYIEQDDRCDYVWMAEIAKE